MYVWQLNVHSFQLLNRHLQVSKERCQSIFDSMFIANAEIPPPPHHHHHHGNPPGVPPLAARMPARSSRLSTSSALLMSWVLSRCLTTDISLTTASS